MELVTPATAASAIDLDLSDPKMVAEEKIDGARYLFYIGSDPYGSDRKVALLSRRKNTAGTYTDRAAQVPHIAKAYPGLEGTILDGEVFLNDCPTTVGIITSGPEVALKKQEAQGYLTYHVYDCMAYCGHETRLKTLKDRQKIMAAAVDAMNNPYVKIVPRLEGDDIEEIFNRVVDGGGEGLVVKNLYAPYGVSWYKLKKSYDISVVITGFQPGRPGQYEGQVGALLLSVYEGDRLVEVGKTSGFSNEMRAKITAAPEAYLNTVIDVFMQEMTPGVPCGRLRHPSFHRERPDMLPTDATYQALLDNVAAAKRARAQRWK